MINFFDRAIVSGAKNIMATDKAIEYTDSIEFRELIISCFINQCAAISGLVASIIELY